MLSRVRGATLTACSAVHHPCIRRVGSHSHLTHICASLVRSDWDGRNPATPHHAAGIRTEPPVSLPIAKLARPEGKMTHPVPERCGKWHSRLGMCKRHVRVEPMCE